MYESFYNLTEKPFDLTHSSRYLYLGESHKEALAMLTYGVMERKGFVLLTGEVGTGKTTMLHALLSELDKSVQCVHLANPLLSPKEFMNYLTLSAFKNRIAFKSKAEFLVAFEAFLTRCSQQQRSFLLLVDEAHKLSFDLLEEIRLLSNMETAEEKLINIFLVGQPELNKKLSDPKCRALLQRISIRYQIKPLDLEGTEEYITKRLIVAGARKADDIFPGAVRKAIHEYSRGYPRMINILSDNLLLLGYARGVRKLKPAMVRDCFEDLKLEKPVPFAKAAPEPVKTITESETRESTGGDFWKWAFIGLLAILLGAAAFFYGEEIRLRVERFVAGHSKSALVTPLAADRKEVHEEVSSLASSQSLEASRPDTETTVTPFPGEDKKKDDSGLPDLELAEKTSIGPHEKGFSGEPEKPTPVMGNVDTPLPAPAGSTPDSSGETTGVSKVDGRTALAHPTAFGESLGERIIVKEGDTLERLARRTYGRVDEEILFFVQKHNPAITDLNVIATNQEIYFPALSTMRD
jgi:type II secretory pathway predicted ATPase ExeA/phage tail protein X